jgi:circadian clock protein KaiC
MSSTPYTTGNAPLDAVLGGGIPSGSTTILAGLPGTGKTILAEQFLCANATKDAPALYLTTFSEPMERVVHYLQGFSFFQPDLVPDAIRYLDIGQQVREHGIDQLGGFVEQLLLELTPSIIVIDSFKALRDMVEDPREFRLAIFDLARVISALGVTAILVGEYTSLDISTLPEFAVADAIIEMINRPRGIRDERAVRVHKLRGAAHIGGEHSFRISTAGLEVFPRLMGTEDRLDAAFEERLASGVSELDRLLGGGLRRGSSTLVAGPTGVGKTMLALTYLLEGARRGEPGVLVSFQESPSNLRRYAAGFGADLGRLEDEGLLRVIYVSPLELDLVELFAWVRDAIEEKGSRRVVVDALNDMLEAAIDRSRFRAAVWSLGQYLAVHGVTGVLLMETPFGQVDISVSAQMDLSYMADNIILLRYTPPDSYGRTVQVLKTRGSDHDPRSHPMRISAGGMEIFPSSEEAAHGRS